MESEQAQDTLGRIVRTAVQLAAGGGLAALFEQVAHDVPTSVTPYVVIFATLLVAVCQNVAEENGWLKPLLKARSKS